MFYDGISDLKPFFYKVINRKTFPNSISGHEHEGMLSRDHIDSHNHVNHGHVVGVMPEKAATLVTGISGAFALFFCITFALHTYHM